jgi:hypothetical protein
MADYGYAPYQEASNKGQARMSVLQRIAGALAGAGQGIQASEPGAGAGNLFTGFSRSYILSNASKRAAEDYAMKQQQAEEASRSRAIQDRLNEAYATRAERPEKPEPPPKDPRPWYLQPDYRDTPEAQAARKKAEHIGGGDGTPKPPKVSEAKASKLERELFALSQSEDTNELIKVSNDANLEPETRRRAWAKYQRIINAQNPSQVR